MIVLVVGCTEREILGIQPSRSPSVETNHCSIFSLIGCDLSLDPDIHLLGRGTWLCRRRLHAKSCWLLQMGRHMTLGDQGISARKSRAQISKLHKLFEGVSLFQLKHLLVVDCGVVHISSTLSDAVVRRISLLYNQHGPLCRGTNITSTQIEPCVELSAHYRYS